MTEPRQIAVIENLITKHMEGCKAIVMASAYVGTDRAALFLVDKETGERLMVATVNLPDIPCPPGHVFIKDYAENEGIREALEMAGVIGAEEREITYDYGTHKVVFTRHPVPALCGDPT